MTHLHDTNNTLMRGRLNLLANRQGSMTIQQKDWIKRDMRNARRTQNQQIFISGLVFLVVMVVLALMPFVIVPVIFIPVIWGVGVIAWIVYTRQQEAPIREDLERGMVESATDYVDKNASHGYHIIVDHQEYSASQEMYEAFDDTLRYVIYFTPKSKIVLSAEESPDNDDDQSYKEQTSDDIDADF